MGELMGNSADSAQSVAVKSDNDVVDVQRYKTDVKDVYANGEKNGMPVFDVTDKEFYANMKADRRRLRFSSGSHVQKYHKNTKYNKPFYIRNTKDGYLSRIK